MTTLAALFASYLVVLIRTAWLCDDAYITFRTVDNFLHGFGLRWNVYERVQAYTHPLWTLLLTGLCAITGETYFTSLVLSVFVSLLMLSLLAFRVAIGRGAAALILSVAVLSKAFVDYSSSGLENPLLHLLIVLFGWLLLAGDLQEPRGVVGLGLLAGLAIMTRMDSALLLGPALVLVLWERRSASTVGKLALGFVPLFLWEVVSVVYYGFPFPNTAYAKLGTEIPSAELWRQGLAYLSESLGRDPVTLTVVGLACAGAVRAKNRRICALASGILLWLVYVTSVGGDFMSGRFLTPALVMALVLLARLPILSTPGLPALLPIVLIWSISPVGGKPPLLSGSGYSAASIPNHGVSDERGFFYQATGLLQNWGKQESLPAHPWARQGLTARSGSETVAVRASIGFFGYYAGGNLRIIDPYALSDPLLARLPALPYWRVGHYQRLLPDGYRDSVEHGKNLLRDPMLSRLYDRLTVVTQGPLLSMERLRAIWFLNSGAYRRLVRESGYRESAWASAQAGGDLRALNLIITIRLSKQVVADEDRIFLSASTGSRRLFFDGSQWTSDAVPVATGVPATGTQRLEVFREADASRFANELLYAGVGTSVDDVTQESSFMPVYRFPGE